MNIKFFTLLISALLLVPSINAAQHDMRFHCDQDTIKINELLQKGLQQENKDPNALVVFYANELLGTPYVAHTLEGDKEYLTINIHQLDCTIFVETLYALARTTMNGRYSWRDFANNLESIRYRNGHMDGYPSRLHYVSDWIVDNTHRGNITEVTSEVQGVRYEIKSIDFMSAHRDSYPALADSATFAELKKYEIGYRLHRFPYIKKDMLDSKQVKEKLKSGDFIALVTKTEGLDVSHMAIVVYDEKGKLHMLHASSREGKVALEKYDLKETLRQNRNCTGIRVIRIKE